MTTATNTRPTTVCFTGHRPKDLYGYGKETDYDYIHLAATIEQMACKRLYRTHNARRFITGGAQGSDQCAFWAVHHMQGEGYDVRNDVFIPFEEQPSHWGDHGLFGKRKYAEMLSLADSVTDCSDPRSAPIPNLMKRNRDMVDASDIVVCVWNKPYAPGIGGKHGGTNACTLYALKRGRPVFVVDLVQRREYWLGEQ